MKDYYKILEIERNTTEREIRKKTYFKGKLLHPKKNNSLNYDPHSFIEVIEAYTVLHDKATKEVYDWILDHEGGIHKLSDEALQNN